jgi:hypothetical protein
MVKRCTWAAWHPVRRGPPGRGPCPDDPHLAAPEDHWAPEQLISHGFGRSRNTATRPAVWRVTGTTHRPQRPDPGGREARRSRSADGHQTTPRHRRSHDTLGNAPARSLATMPRSPRRRPGRWRDCPEAPSQLKQRPPVAPGTDTTLAASRIAKLGASRRLAGMGERNFWGEAGWLAALSWEVSVGGRGRRQRR